MPNPIRKRTSFIALGAVGAVAAAIVVTGLVGGTSGSGGGGTASRAGVTNDGAVVAGSAGSATAVPSATASVAQAGAPAGTSGHGAFVAVEIGTARIRTVQMSVQVRRGTTVAAKAGEAEAIALQAGGEIDADERTSGRYAEATLVLRVPPEALVDTLTALSRLGIETSRHFASQDVTARVADVSSRVTSARVAIARLRVLYGRARKITDVITLEDELSSREGDLESLEAQQRALATQTSTATVTITLTSPPALVKKHVVVPPKKHVDHTGFLGGLRNGWHAFSSAAVAVATFVGAVLPFAILFLLTGLLGRWVWPRIRPTRTPVPAPAPPQ